MSRGRGVGVCAIVCAIVTMAAASAASAEAPEFGRCVKVAKGFGVYATSNCTSAGGEQAFVWTPSAENEPMPFALTSKPGTPVYIQGGTSHAKEVTCAQTEGAGNITGPKAFMLHLLRMTGCGDCHTFGLPEGTIEYVAATVTLGIIKKGASPTRTKIGLALGGEARFYCGESKTPNVLEGSGIGQVSPTDSMAVTRKWVFKVPAQANRQIPEAWEDSLPQSFMMGPPVGLAMTLEVSSSTKFEINTVV
jgi:hypothetical protein